MSRGDFIELQMNFLDRSNQRVNIDLIRDQGKGALCCSLNQ